MTAAVENVFNMYTGTKQALNEYSLTIQHLLPLLTGLPEPIIIPVFFLPLSITVPSSFSTKRGREGFNILCAAFLVFWLYTALEISPNSILKIP